MAVVRHKISIVGTALEYPCPETLSVLNAMAQLGRKGIPLGCRSGGCGVCKVAVVSGAYERAKMSRAHVSVEDEAAGRVLACCIRPLSDLQVAVIGSIQKAFPEQPPGPEQQTLTAAMPPA